MDGARLFYEGREVFMKANYITPAVTVFSEDGSIHFEEQGKVYEHLMKRCGRHSESWQYRRVFCAVHGAEEG